MFWRKGHDRYQGQLSAYIDDRLLARDRQALEAHLESCLTCRQALQHLQATVQALLALSLEEAPRSFALRQEQVAPRPFEPGSRPALPLGGLAVPIRLAAASLAVALAVLVVVDMGDFGGDGEVRDTTPSAERAFETGQAQGEAPAESAAPESSPAPTDSAAESEGRQTAQADDGLDPLRAAEIALAAALGILIVAFAIITLRTRRSL